MIQLRNGDQVRDARLDRLPSQTTEHLERYPLTAATLPSRDVSIQAGFDWYPAFDRPRQVYLRGRWRRLIGEGDLGRARGGHAVCLRHWRLSDARSWWAYYDQGTEGRCPEFSLLRVMSQVNRRRYDVTSRWHYWTMQRLDEWAGGSYPGASPAYEGSSVRAAMEVARLSGLVRDARRPLSFEEASGRVSGEDGIARFRWATSWADVRQVLAVPDWLPGVPLNNSWGVDYPREVILVDAAGERLLREGGEFAVPTDR